MVTYVRAKPSAGSFAGAGRGSRSPGLGRWETDRTAKALESRRWEGGTGCTIEAHSTDAAGLYAHLRETVAEKTIECAVLDRNQPGSSKYRALTPEELGRLLPKDVRASLS